MSADTSAVDLPSQVLVRYGGLAQWRGIDRLEVAFSSGGLAFQSRWVPHLLLNKTGTIFPRSYRVEIAAFPKPGFKGWFDGFSVGISSDNGVTLRRRDNARSAFKAFRRSLWWDELDLMYFAGYALWNYLCFPFFLAREDLKLRRLKRPLAVQAMSGLEVEFPFGFPTHNPIQQFFFDGDSTLVRHDYTAEVIGWWAHAAHFACQHMEFDGFLFPTRRIVHPRITANRSQRFPTLVWIRIEDIHCVGG